MKYGKPKPIELTEGGPDVAQFHGSFFSFADPRSTGDWDRGSDQYPRMFLSSIAAGIQRLTAYSIHGVHRHGTNAGPVLVKGRQHRVSGTVAMDQLVVDVGEADVRVGDEVVLFGADGVRAGDWAEAIGTIDYEVVTWVGARVPRQHVVGPR